MKLFFLKFYGFFDNIIRVFPGNLSLMNNEIRYFTSSSRQRDGQLKKIGLQTYKYFLSNSTNKIQIQN